MSVGIVKECFAALYWNDSLMLPLHGKSLVLRLLRFPALPHFTYLSPKLGPFCILL